MSGNVASRVGFDEQIEVAGLVVARDGGIRSHNLLSRAIRLRDSSTDGDVLADRKAEDGCRSR